MDLGACPSEKFHDLMDFTMVIKFGFVECSIDIEAGTHDTDMELH